MPENRGSWQDPKAHSSAIKDCKENLCLSPFPWGPSTGGGDDHICRNCLPGNDPEPSTVVPELLRIFSYSPATSSGKLSSLPLCWAASTPGTGKGRAPTFLNPLHLAFDCTHHGI